MDNSWLSNRNCGIHMTIRDVDCENFDAEQMAKDFHRMGVNFFSFFAGGYITTYPSNLSDSRLSPWLNGQDVTGDIVKAAHKYNIKAIAMADLSILPPEVYARHPDWAMVDKTGKPYESVSGMYTACVMGDYAEKYGKPMVHEILSNYDVDAMKFGGGSYGFGANICHCEKCRKSFYESFQEEIPEKKDWDNPVWQNYYIWRTRQTSKRVQFLHNLVTDICPDMPVMGNGVCFSDINWTINSALDMEGMAYYQDMIQIEAQTRCQIHPDLQHDWQSAHWTAEEAVYMTNVTDKPIWIVVSYFKAWPWRRSAIDYAEQKAYLAQIVANGASPMVNLSGGPPSVHEDKRGFQAPTEIWQFVRDHNCYFSGDKSGAQVAFVYSAESLIFYGKNNPESRYLEAMRGYERALRENHIPFDIISKNMLNPDSLARYKTLIFTNYACMSEIEANAIRAFVHQGGNIIATFETSLYDENGKNREDFLLGDILDIQFDGLIENVNGSEPDGLQNYLEIKEGAPLTDAVIDAGLIPVAGNYCRVRTKNGDIPFTLSCPFIVFPEGLSYPSGAVMGYPGVVTCEQPNGGRTVYFSGQLDRLHYISGFGEISTLLAEAVRWTLNGALEITTNAPDSVSLSIRVQESRVMIHLVNLTGGSRMLQKIIPVQNISLTLCKNPAGSCHRAFTLSSGENLSITKADGGLQVQLPELLDYEVIVFE